MAYYSFTKSRIDFPKLEVFAVWNFIAGNEQGSSPDGQEYGPGGPKLRVGALWRAPAQPLLQVCEPVRGSF
jgi:hypothetical protein